MSKHKFCTSAKRHMKIKYHYIREKIQDGSIKVAYRPTTSIVADIMTKALDRKLFELFRGMLLNGIDEEGHPL